MHTLGDLADPVEPIHQTTTGAEVFELLHENPNLLAVAVVDGEGRPVGLVERNSFALKMGSAYGRALYAGRPIVRLMDENPLVAGHDRLVSDFAAEVLAGGTAGLLKGIVVVREGAYVGIASVVSILRAVTDHAHTQTKALSALSSGLMLAEGEASAANHLLKEALNAMSEGVAIFDGDGRCVLWNHKYAERHTESSDVITVGAPFRAILEHATARGEYPDAVGREAEWIESRMARRSSLEGRAFEEQQLRDGRTLRIEDTRLATGGVISVAVDVTDTKRREASLEAAVAQAEAANRAKTEFLANMSHEIRTPLNGVLGVASVLSGTKLTFAQSEMVGIIESSAKSLQVLLNDLLDVSKIEAGHLKLEPGVVSVATLARQTVALFEATAAEKGLTIGLELDDGAARSVIADGVRLKQILTNLCSNAIKFTHKGGLTLTVTGEPRPDTQRIRIGVSDTGIGIPPAARACLFERFSQADGSITRRFGGTGLGLSISQHLATLMGGTIRVASEEGRGSTFSLELDLPRASGMDQKPADTRLLNRPDDGQAGFEQRLRVLLVEDHPVNRQVISLMIGDLVDLVVAEDGAEAVSIEARQPFDVILMDMQMPVMDGITATRAIRTREHIANDRATPIIMLTANVLPDHIAQAKGAGASAHLAKPITTPALLQAIEDALAPLACNDLQLTG